MKIIEAVEVNPAMVEAFARLIPQLSSSNPPPDAQTLAAIVDSPACQLLLAVDEEEILGALTLVIFPIPTGLRAWIEDVVVDSAARGRGVGEILNTEALDRARSAGCTTVDLTSRPSREAANRLYQRIGFELRSTNVYRYNL